MRGSAASIVEIDIEPFYETARLLYEGPWVAERAITAKPVLDSDPDALHPVTREIIVSGLKPTAMDAFAAFYKLEALRRVAERTFATVDALALPTAPTAYTVAQVLADPIQLNSRLGTYTNFVNLLDLCGLALPAAFTPAGVPFGITLLAPGGNDARSPQSAACSTPIPNCRSARFMSRSRLKRRRDARASRTRAQLRWRPLPKPRRMTAPQRIAPRALRARCPRDDEQLTTSPDSARIPRRR